MSILSGLLGIGSLLGNSILGGVSSAINIRKQYKYNLALQNDAQEHQKEMFQNQHQWSVDDLRAAGLNPILSTHAGSSMPSAGMNSVSAQNYIPDLIGDLAELQGFSSARDMQKFNRENHNVELAQKEADLASKEVDNAIKHAQLDDIYATSALKMLDLEYFSQPWYKDFRGWKDIKSATGMDSKVGQILSDFSNVFERGRYNWQRGGTPYSSSAIEIYKRPSKSRFTKYQYKTR